MTPRNQVSTTVLLGPAGSGKTAAALAEYRDALLAGRLGADRRQLWVAPTRSVAADVREALVDPRHAILDPGVTTLADLAADALREAGVRVRPIAPLQRRRLLGRLIDEAAAAGRLKYFAPVAGSPGLVARVDQWIADLQRRGTPPGSDAAGDDPAARDVADLYARYENVLAAADLVDAAGLLRTATHALASSRLRTATHLLASSRNPGMSLDLVVVDGFADFTALELALLSQLAARSRRTLVTLPGEAEGWHAQGPPQGVGASQQGQPRPAADLGRATPRVDLFAQPRAAAIRIAEALGANVEVRTVDLAPWPALAHLERNLFRNLRDMEPLAPDAAASLGNIHIVAASGVQAEIDELARRVKRLLVDGVAPGDVVVAFRSTRDVADRVRQAFDDFGIPTALDATRRLATTPLVRSLTNVLRLAAEDWSYRRLLRVAADRSLRLLDAEPTARTAIESCVRHAQLPSGRGALLAELERWTQRDDADAEPTAAAAQVALTALRELGAMLDVLPRRATIDGWVAALGPLAERLGLIRPAAGDTAGNWAILTGALQAAEQLDAWTGWGGEELPLAAFIELVASTAAAAPATSRHDLAGRVRVLSAQRARFTRPRHLLVGGLSEQAFPAVRRSAGADDPDGQSAAQARSAEMLLFYQLVTRPTETLTLSYPALDERAQTLPASPFLAELERAFGDAELPRTVQPLDGGRRTADHAATAPLSRSALRRGAVARALDRDRDLLAALTKAEGPAMLDAIEAVADRGGREFGAFEGLVESDAGAAQLRERFGPGHLWSPSQLERYAACPFVFFGETLLNLRPLPELALESDVRRRGSVLHETLARLYGELRGKRLDPDQVAAVLADQFHAALADVAEAHPGRGLDAALREIERRQIAAWADGFARQDAEYRAQWTTMDHPPEPAHFEVRFGPDTRRRGEPDEATLSTDKPFQLAATIDGAEEQVKFTGRIDRIDVGRVGASTVFNVIDYKTSKSAAVKEEEIHAGRQLQLPLYAMAVETLLLDKEQAVPLSAGYWSVKGKGFGRTGRSTGALDVNQVRQGALEPAPGWEQTRDALVARIGQIIADIRRGRFPVFNVDPQCTSTCDLRTVCRIAQIRSLEKQWPPGSNAEAQE